jgi:hypothetical protein
VPIVRGSPVVLPWPNLPQAVPMALQILNFPSAFSIASFCSKPPAQSLVHHECRFWKIFHATLASGVGQQSGKWRHTSLLCAPSSVSSRYARPTCPEDPHGRLPHAPTNEFAHALLLLLWQWGLQDIDDRDDRWSLHFDSARWLIVSPLEPRSETI